VETRRQRREVAVLFADISGFTGLVEAFEPEVVHDVVRPLMDTLVSLVHRYGGEIQQVLGDGFMAVFGLSSTTGDEAERATRAALALVHTGWDEVHPPVHVGLEYGEVLVTQSWEPATFGVWGRAVTMAKRLCDTAGPGQVHVGPGAYGQAGTSLADATATWLTLKGIAHTVPAYRLSRDGSRALAAVS
jgi:class 3 adenylate cyclase